MFVFSQGLMLHPHLVVNDSLSIQMLYRNHQKYIEHVYLRCVMSKQAKGWNLIWTLDMQCIVEITIRLHRLSQTVRVVLIPKQKIVLPSLRISEVFNF